jgi:hypothetical protein
MRRRDAVRMNLGPRTATALTVAAFTLAVSAVLAVLFDFFFLFLFVPFVPFLFGNEEEERRRVRVCPACGFRTREEGYEYCPHDGEELRTERFSQN